MRWERELPQYIRKLRNQHVHYAQTTRILFEPITSAAELEELMSAGSHDLWKSEELAAKLKDRLQESYQAYQATMSDIEGLVAKIASKMDLDRASEVRDIQGNTSSLHSNHLRSSRVTTSKR
jgi:hypothetical protein